MPRKASQPGKVNPLHAALDDLVFDRIRRSQSTGILRGQLINSLRFGAQVQAGAVERSILRLAEQERITCRADCTDIRLYPVPLVDHLGLDGKLPPAKPAPEGGEEVTKAE